MEQFQFGTWVHFGWWLNVANKLIVSISAYDVAWKHCFLLLEGYGNGILVGISSQLEKKKGEHWF